MKVRFIVVIPVGFGVHSLLPGKHTRAQSFLSIISFAIDSIVVADTDITFTNSPPPPLPTIEVLFGIAEKVKNFAVIYLVDIDEVPDFNGMYELYDACTTMFFYRNKHIMVDLGTGNNNKINWALGDKQELIDIIEIVYRGARKGRGLVVSPKDYSTKYRY
jgi:DIM1 family U5 snRNP protein